MSLESNEETCNKTLVQVNNIQLYVGVLEHKRRKLNTNQKSMYK